MGWGEIELRHDCDYYRPSHIRLLAKMNASGWQVIPLRALSPHIVDGPFGSAIKAEDYVDEGVPFIRVADVTRGNGTIRADQMIYISEEAHEAIRRSATKPGDIVVAKTGATMGAASIVPQTLPVANIRGDLALVGQLASPLDAQYLEAYFNSAIGYKLFWRLNSGSTRGRVVISNLKRYPVVWPDDQTKANVVALLTGARQSVSALEAQAAALFASIDDYLLAELGIVLPPETENTLANRTFCVQAHELGGWRFDPLFHSFKMWHAIENSGIPSARIGAVCSSVRTGFAAGGNDQASDEDGIIQIRPTNIDADRRLKFDRNIYVSSDIATRRPREILNPGEVLFNNTNSQALVGKTTYFELTDQLYTCSNHITRLMVERNEILPEYLTAILNLYQRRKAFFSVCTNWNNQSGVGADLLRKIIIPVAEMEMQRKIVAELDGIFTKAENLKTTATAELEAAKRAVEAILLGAE